jgi:hypothetical protein
MIRRINRILHNYLGVRLTGSGKGFLKKVGNHRTKPVCIEFVGVQGVGKTTLLENASNANNNKWLDARDFKYLFFHHLNHNMLDNAPDFYQELASHKLQRVAKRNYSSADKMRVLSFHYSVLKDDVLFRQFNKNYTIVSDEGMMHSYGSSIRELYDRDKERFDEKWFKEFLKGRAIVYCYAPAEHIAKQVVRRAKLTGKLVPPHKVNSFVELVMELKKELKNKSTFINILQGFDVPMLSINTSDNIAHNAERVNNFIKELQTIT